MQKVEGMSSLTTLSNIVIEYANKILNSYDRLHEFEKKGCTYEQIRKELVTIKNSTESLSSIIPKLMKVRSINVETQNINDVFKISYFPTLKIHLVYLSENQESKNELLKIQARLAITYLNVDECMNSLKILRTLLRN